MLELKYISTYSLLISCHIPTKSVNYFQTFSCECKHHIFLYLDEFWREQRGGNCKNNLVFKARKWFLMIVYGHLSKCLSQCISFLLFLC